MSVGSVGSGSPDLVHLLMARKQMDAEKAQSAELLQMLAPQPVAPPPAASAQRTWYL